MCLCCSTLPFPPCFLFCCCIWNIWNINQMELLHVCFAQPWFEGMPTFHNKKLGGVKNKIFWSILIKLVPTHFPTQSQHLGISGSITKHHFVYHSFWESNFYWKLVGDWGCFYLGVKILDESLDIISHISCFWPDGLTWRPPYFENNQKWNREGSICICNPLY